MGVDWYCALARYGHLIVAPGDTDCMKFARKIIKEFDDKLEEPFEIINLLQEFHSRLEGSYDEDRDLDEQANLIIGFRPSWDLNKTVELATRLKEYIASPMFKDLIIIDSPDFYTGINWVKRRGDDSDDDDDGDSDYEESSEDDSDVTSEESDEDESEESEEENEDPEKESEESE